jgi:hypothetical protein
MKYPNDMQALSAEAQRRSGRPDLAIYPVPQAGTVVVLCRLSDNDHRAFVDGLCSQDAGTRATAKNVALAAARVWPEQGIVAAAIDAIPNLDKALMQEVERLGGGDVQHLQIVDVRPSLDDSTAIALGIDPAALAKARKQYPHDGQLKIASYSDTELEIQWACILRLPRSAAADSALAGLNERGHETVVTFAINCMAWPERDQAASFVRGQYHIAFCLWTTLYAWALVAAKQRPTIWRPKSSVLETSTQPPTSLEKSSAILESPEQKPADQAVS